MKSIFFAALSLFSASALAAPVHESPILCVQDPQPFDILDAMVVLDMAPNGDMKFSNLKDMGTARSSQQDDRRVFEQDFVTWGRKDRYRFEISTQPAAGDELYAATMYYSETAVAQPMKCGLYTGQKLVIINVKGDERVSLARLQEMADDACQTQATPISDVRYTTRRTPVRFSNIGLTTSKQVFSCH